MATRTSGHVASLVDEARIVTTVRAYAIAIDRRDFDLLGDLVTDNVQIDFTSYDPSREPVTVPSMQWIVGLRPQLVGLDATLHTISSVDVMVRGDRATAVSEVTADHHFADAEGEPTYTLRGRYVDRLVRDGDLWRITAKSLTVESQEGNREIMPAARARGEASIRSDAETGGHRRRTEPTADRRSVRARR